MFYMNVTALIDLMTMGCQFHATLLNSMSGRNLNPA
jgi:hypothetical protein